MAGVAGPAQAADMDMRSNSAESTRERIKKFDSHAKENAQRISDRYQPFDEDFKFEEKVVLIKIRPDVMGSRRLYDQTANHDTEH